MELLGLSRHNPPAAFIWGDVGPNVAALATLAGARGDAREVAGWLHCGNLAYRRGVPESGFNAGIAYTQPAYEAFGERRADGPFTLSPSVEALPLPRAHEVAAIIRGWKDEEPRALWERLKAAGWPSLMPPKGKRWGKPIVGRWLGPARVEEVAGWMWCGSQAYKPGNVESGLYSRTNGNQAVSTEQVACEVGLLPSRWPSVACYQGTATRLVEQLPERLDSVIAYLDPPYSGTTGYKFGGCPREEVLRLALDLHWRGATVAVSEAVRLDRELGDGWTAVQIDGERRGAKRTFSKQQSEWVTLNRPPVQVPGQQQGLFGGAR